MALPTKGLNGKCSCMVQKQLLHSRLTQLWRYDTRFEGTRMLNFEIWQKGWDRIGRASRLSTHLSIAFEFRPISTKILRIAD